MICDKLENFCNYIHLHPLFPKVQAFLKGTDIKELEPGRYDIDKGVYAGINEYYTIDEDQGFIESHFKNIDIQIILKGRELVGCCDLNNCKITEKFEERDFQKLEGEYKLYPLEEDMFMIFFDNDAHKPMIKYDSDPLMVKKMVIKVER